MKGEIRFENLSFRYAENEPVLVDFNLTIKPGENLAIVGHTGAGKSSLAKLIARFYEFQTGHILIDGMDIRNYQFAAIPATIRDRLPIAIPFFRDGG